MTDNIPTEDDYRNAARALYSASSDDDIEIDDNAELSAASEGAWVQAWVRVPNSNFEESDQ